MNHCRTPKSAPQLGQAMGGTNQWIAEMRELLDELNAALDSDRT